MGATIQIGGARATVEDGLWNSESKPLARVLNVLCEEGRGEQNNVLARAMATRLRGQVVRLDPDEVF